MIAYLLSGLSLGVVAWIPGPFQAFIVNRAIQDGWQRTWPAAFAPLLSDGPISALMIFLVAQAPLAVLHGIQIAGGLFVLYLAWGAWQSWDNFRPEAMLEADDDVPQSFWQAVLVNLLNPNPYIFWGTVGATILVEGWRVSPWASVLFLLGFYFVLCGSFIVIIVVFSSSRRLGPQLQRVLLAVSVVGLAIFGTYQLVDGIVKLARFFAS
ncbi:MAG: LysE family transporter [Chloroflexi bacterium]|nr:LysE family transporter [Chloroflexota bacterium]